MNEVYILDMLVLNGLNYHKYKSQHFEEAFGFWMEQLQRVKGFRTMDEACEYFLDWGGGAETSPNIFRHISKQLEIMT
ncbi:hypothetical protein [Lysinibacillus endophyticus]|uniref:hypothetical protein n=1 Tax=Ureibacillus endophyticus TaxID=1978490 RepID=UPI0020A01719|nr:hypothetical protein [Lysinibacillus endophyticus]MCP1144909.1 hypothetical protein [Lysinibacillus endophyticus]